MIFPLILSLIAFNTRVQGGTFETELLVSPSDLRHEMQSWESAVARSRRGIWQHICARGLTPVFANTLQRLICGFTSDEGREVLSVALLLIGEDMVVCAYKPYKDHTVV